MARKTNSLRIASEALKDGLARLADVAPTSITVLTEESDWGLVGGDLRDAMDSEHSDHDDDPPADDRHELVEA